MQKQSLKAEKRKVLGRKVKKLRREGILPANIYGKKIKSQAIQVPLAEFNKIFKKVGETGVVELSVNSSNRPVLINSVQLDPVSDTPIHADFLQVDLKEKVTAGVPVELTGESPAEKQGLGTVVQQIDEIEVEALPGDLPEKFEIDLSVLTEVNQQVQVKDLTVDKKKVEVKQDGQQIIVKVEPPRKEEEAAPLPKEEVPEEEAPKEEAAAGEKAPEESATEAPVGETQEAQKKEKSSKGKKA